MFIVLSCLLVVIAFIFIVPPLMGRSGTAPPDQEHANQDASRQRLKDLERDVDNDLVADSQVEHLREETETTLMLEMQQGQARVVKEKSRRFHLAWTILVCLSVPVVAFLVYLSVGTPAALKPEATTTQAQDPAGQSLEELVEKLEQRLAEYPGDEQGWLILAQTNMITGRYPEAVAAMESLYKLTGDTPDVLARYADAVTMANEGRFNDKATDLVARALQMNPDHVHALWLSGMQAYQAENFAAAVDYFDRARVHITDAENLAQLDDLTRSAIERGNLDVQVPAQEARVVAPGIDVSVSLDPALASGVSVDDTLFVFARAASGPPMPLAVHRGRAGDLPLTVRLDDSMAMMPELKLSAFDEVVISARISKSGQPAAQSGDFQRESEVLNPEKTIQVKLQINQVIE